MAGILITMGSLSIPEAVKAQSGPAQSASQQYRFSIPSKPLEAALNLFIEQTGWQVSYQADLVQDRRSNPVSGSMSAREALLLLVPRKGMLIRFSGEKAAALVSSTDARTDPDSTVLDTITVIAETIKPGDVVYESPGPVSHITEETINRYRGSSPADIFRGVPGVISGEARNGAGSIDVNIRGMQGMGRVAVTIDGATNSTTVYQGYQGVSNRTFVDPDFLGGVDIKKGADLASSGIAGSVAMRTLDARDIVKPGETIGVRLKIGAGTNSSTPPPGGTAGGYAWPDSQPTSVLVPSEHGLDRPNALKPTNGSTSLIAAVKSKSIDLVAGHAYRKQGNYHAGTNGPTAQPQGTGVIRQYCPQPIINCLFFGVPFVDGTELFYNVGAMNYRAGEEVLNSELETRSWLAKATVRFNEDHAIKIGFNKFQSETGDRLASRIVNNNTQPVQQNQTSGTDVNSTTLQYRWNPDDDLFDVKANSWYTSMALQNQRIFQLLFQSPTAYGLPADFRTGPESKSWGGDITNNSLIETDFGSLDLSYGLSYLGEDTRPDDNTLKLATVAPLNNYNYRDGYRHEISGFSKFSWSPTDWLTAKAGLKYQRSWTRDRGRSGSKTSFDGFSPSVGILFEPIEGLQLYGDYSNVMRMPSIFESVAVFGVNVNSDLTPEKSSNFEIGVNLKNKDLITSTDRSMLKLGYFNWTVTDYISREWYTDPVTSLPGFRMFNIDKAKFAGLELSGLYEVGGFSAELAANYYTNVEFCRTAGACENKSLYGDYSTNHVPPQYTVNLSLAQEFFGGALTIDGRASHIGPRAIGHGDATAGGNQQFVSLIDWEPYTLFDAFIEYEFNENLSARFRAENLTDEFYVDALSLVNQPGPGRTFYFSLTANF